jgi:hypothetical protein
MAQRVQVQVEEKRRDATPSRTSPHPYPGPSNFSATSCVHAPVKHKARGAEKRKRPAEDHAAVLSSATGASERGLPDLEDEEDEEDVPEIVNQSGDEEDGEVGPEGDPEDEYETGFTLAASEDESVSDQDDQDDSVHGTEVSVPFPFATTVVSNTRCPF